ncbi:MAG TPA: winged helix DNA-binding domain-containing protein [Ktedonobacteraceae bacterium]|nr:winged helix DNA-binding domain-containing protein [Ktedonobacteraceae bacterium]
MPERVLTLRTLNRATLARQMLLERTSLPALDAVERLAGLQAQMPNPPYIGLWTRLQSFQRDDLTRLLEQRQVVRATMMRSTLHLMTSADYLLLRPALQLALTRALHAFFAQQAKNLNVGQFVDAARAYIEEQPRTFVEIRAKLAELFPDTDPALMAYVVRTHLPLVQVPPGGTWGFTGSPAHVLAEAWLGRSLTASAEAWRLLVHRYLAAFGPATVKDIQAWSGLTRLQSVIKELKAELRTFRDEQGNELLDLPDAPLPPETVAAPVRFLPEFDNLILSHADRRRVIADEYRPSIFLSAGRVRATFLVDGFVYGTWKIERIHDKATLVIEPFKPLPASVQDELVAEGERLVRFVEDRAETFEVVFANQ